MAPTHSITKFDNSLTEFLINEMSSKYENAKSYAYRYNNLKVYMDPSKVFEPHFFVSIGISEACFAIENGKKIEGGLGIEDGYVKKWSDRINIHKELENHWKLMKEAISAEESRRLSAKILLRRVESADENLNVDMTSTGINKVKREEFQEKRKYLRKLKNNKKVTKDTNGDE